MKLENYLIALEKCPDEKSDVVRAERYHRRKRTVYNLGMMLHPYLDREIEGLPEIKGLPHNHHRALALVIGKIGEYAITKRIPLCFPESRGWSHIEDYSRVVFFP